MLRHVGYTVLMKRARAVALRIRSEPQVKKLIKEVSEKTGLSQAAVKHSALGLGLPELMKRLNGCNRPRRNFAEYLGRFAGVLNRNRELVKPSRVK